MQLHQLAGLIDELEKIGVSMRNAGFMQSRRGIRPIRVDTLVGRESRITEPEQVAQDPELDQPAPPQMANDSDEGDPAVGKTASSKGTKEKAMRSFVAARPYLSSAAKAAVPAAMLGGVYGGPRSAKLFGAIGATGGLVNQALKDWAQTHKRKDVAKDILRGEKTAGVGVDIHGYYRKPENPKLEKAEKEYNERFFREVGPQPEWKQRGLFKSFIKGPGLEPPKEMKAWRQKADAWNAKNPLPDDPFDYERDSRIKTPYDRDSSRGYKMHLGVLLDSPFADSLATDKGYRDTPQVVNLNKGDIRKLIKDYQERRQVGNKDEELAQDAFVNKAKALLRNPKLRFARVEYE